MAEIGTVMGVLVLRIQLLVSYMPRRPVIAAVQAVPERSSKPVSQRKEVLLGFRVSRVKGLGFGAYRALGSGFGA